MNVEIVVIYVLGQLGIFSIIAFLIKGLIQKSLDKDLERFKSRLQTSVTEHQIRYAKLHDDRAEVIRSTFTKIVVMHRSMKSYMNAFQSGRDDKEVRQNLEKKGVKAADDINEFIDYYSENEIFFSEEICKNMNRLIEIVREAWWTYDLQIVNAPRGQSSIKHWDKIEKTLTEDIPTIKKQLIEQMRQILGVIDELPVE
jgi:hypothetical protein